MPLFPSEEAKCKAREGTRVTPVDQVDLESWAVALGGVFSDAGAFDQTLGVYVAPTWSFGARFYHHGDPYSAMVSAPAGAVAAARAFAAQVKAAEGTPCIHVNTYADGSRLVVVQVVLYNAVGRLV